MLENQLFDRKEHEALEKAQRLLVMVLAPNIAPHVAALGYDDVEHDTGWDLYRKAVGMNRTFSDSLEETRFSKLFNGSPDQNQRIKLIDQFENKWFPRTKNALSRYVSEENREEVVSAFFLNLSQQPEGPQVIASVETYLNRLKDLRSSSTPGVQDAYQSLVKKGLTEVEQSNMRKLLTEAQQAPTMPKTPLTQEEREKAQQAQREAFEQLKLWYKDWADIFRDELPFQLRLRLGVTKVRRSKSSEEDAVEVAE